MKIDKDTAVTLRFTVAESNGKVIENGKTPIAYLHGGYDNLLPKIEAALQDQEVGFKATLDLAPEDAFGLRDESLLRTISKKDFLPASKSVRLCKDILTRVRKPFTPYLKSKAIKSCSTPITR